MSAFFVLKDPRVAFKKSLRNYLKLFHSEKSKGSGVLLLKKYKSECIAFLRIRNYKQARRKVLKVGGAIALEPAKSWGAKQRAMYLSLEILGGL